MTRDRFILALDCAARAGGTLSMRAKEAGELAELLRVGQSRVKTTQAEWTLEQYRQATEMLCDWEGDRLTERVGSCLAHLRRLERERENTDKVLTAVSESLAALRRMLP